jgi:hypothetical protein
MALSQNNNHTFSSGELVTSAKLNSTKIIQTDTEANNDGFTGNPGQLTYDSTNKKLRLHDGTTAGGLEVTPTQEGVSLGAGSVTENMLATGAVTETKLATDSVTEEKILDGAVTASKLADGAISLGAGSVTSEMLATGAIASIDDIGDVQTAGTSGGVNHAPSDGDALIWNNSHSHWMPGGVMTNPLGMKAVAWGRFKYGSSGYAPPFYIRHSTNIKFQDVDPASNNVVWGWVLDTPIDNAIVTFNAHGLEATTQTQALQGGMQHNLGRSQIFVAPEGLHTGNNQYAGYGGYSFIIWDVSDSAMFSLDKGDGYPIYSDGDNTITQSGYSSN